MSTDRDVTRIVRSWLEEGVTALPDRVLDSVLDQVPATPQRRVTWWPARRLPAMNNTFEDSPWRRLPSWRVALLGIRFLRARSNIGPRPDAHADRRRRTSG